MPINLRLQNSFYFLICHGNIFYDSEMIQQHLPNSNAHQNPFPASHENCRLLSHLLMYFDSLYCKQYELLEEKSDQGS